MFGKRGIVHAPGTGNDAGGTPLGALAGLLLPFSRSNRDNGGLVRIKCDPAERERT